MGGGGGDDSSARAAEIQTEFQREALAELRKEDELPSQLRRGALGILGGVAGLEGGTENALGLLQQSPIYQAVQATRGSEEEAILRQAQATGGVRGGNVQSALADRAQARDLTALQGALSSYQGLAGLPSNVNAIASSISNIGQTQAQGIIGSAQSAQSQQQSKVGGAVAGATLGAQVAGPWGAAIGGVGGYLFSDERLKDDIKFVKTVNGHRWYEWTWADAAKKLGLCGRDAGVLAQEVEKTNPEAVSMSNGYKTVNYSQLGVLNA